MGLLMTLDLKYFYRFFQNRGWYNQIGKMSKNFHNQKFQGEVIKFWGFEIMVQNAVDFCDKKWTLFCADSHSKISCFINLSIIMIIQDIFTVWNVQTGAGSGLRVGKLIFVALPSPLNLFWLQVSFFSLFQFDLILKFLFT
jgi:hypothetical protein